MAESEIPTGLVVNAETGEETIRELTAEEITELEALAAEQGQRQAEAEARSAALEALIEAQLNA